MSAPLKCPVCGSPQLALWGTKNAFTLLRCQNCTHVFADIRSTPVDYSDPEKFRTHITQGLMDSDLAYYRHLCESEAPDKQTFLTTQLILQEIGRRGFRTGSSWLDIGSGSGCLVAALQKKGFEAVGVEPGGWGQIAAADKQIRVVAGVLTDQTFPQQFDFVSATDVLEHQADPYAFMKIMKHYLKETGLACLSFPYGGSWRAQCFKARWSMVVPPTHCHFFTRKSIQQLLGNLGFSIERLIQYNTSGFPGMSHIRVSLASANRILSFLGMGDQALVLFRFRKNRSS